MGQGLSSTQFYVFGKKHFTETGYIKHIKKYADPLQKAAGIRFGAEGADGVDMTGKVVLVTGANSGIGKELATYAAAKGAKLYMLCRSKDRAEKAKNEIMEATLNDNINILLADMGELAQVRKMVAELQEKEPKVDCLVCNAGALFNDRRESSEGNEITFASHLLGGSYLLSQLLLPQLKASESGRVIFVSSGGMYNTKFPSWEIATNASKEKYDGQFAYAYAKRGQVLLAEELAKSVPEVSWVSSHPGWCSTDAVDAAYGENKKYLEPMRSAWEGAEGIAWLMSTQSGLESGEFYLDRSPQPKHVAFGSFTKNKPEEVQEMMDKLKSAAGL
ncbi:unnamed protein product [Cylindrotheca closterium]|uniref:Dehydrogenase/reductase SDR family member 12 n=1 Tax=Cylindrotheca closterium TaxID=2856 RepID=A0AAD2G3M0_9STRA|nr:unnamed protein product [Cylindrotheca closterium]